MTATPKPSWKYTRLAYILIVVCWVIYALLNIAAPDHTNNRYHLSAPALLALKLTIIIPIHLIWLLAIRGAIAFKNYSLLIIGGQESRAVDLIADGLFWTIGYFVLNTVLGAVAPFFFGTNAYNPTIIIRDHLAPFISLISFWLIYQGSHRLRDIAKFETWTRDTAWVMVAYGVFSFLFVWQFTTSPIIQGQMAGRTSTAIVPHEILLFTLVVPLLFAWFIGVVATINITKYARFVKGHIYRQALQNLVRGLWFVLSFLIAIQILSFAAKYFADLKITAVLAIIYPLLMLYAIGFLFIRSGARKLAKIEVTQ